MVAVTTPLMTVEEFEVWCERPENRGRDFELDAGRVVEMSRGKRNHGVFNYIVARLLDRYLDCYGSGFLVTHDSGIVVSREPDTLRGPDIMLFLRDAGPDDLEATYGEDRPELIVEVLSPNDRPNSVDRRVRQYLATGVRLVWVLDPEERTLGVHRPGADQTLAETDELTGDGVLPGFLCRVSDLLTPPRRPARPAGGSAAEPPPPPEGEA